MESKRPESTKSPLWKRLLPIVIGVGILVWIFGWVLPQFFDYEAVFRAIGEISFTEWAILIVVALLRFIPEGWVYIAAQPELKSAQGVRLFLVSETMGNVPPGGLDLVSRYQMTRSWGFTQSDATSATIASFVFVTFSKLALPILAVLFLAFSRVRNDDLDFVAIVAVLVVVLGSGVLFAVMRSKSLAAKVGELLGSIVHRVSGIFRKEVHTDFRNLVVEFREQSTELLLTRSPFGLAAGLVARFAAFMVLLIAVRSVGLGPDEIHWTIAFAAFAAATALTVVPFLNMPGIAEAILIGTFNQAAGGGFADQIAAAVFVYRILTWLTPIPFGALAFSRWRADMKREGHVDLLDAFDGNDAGPQQA